jgi:hypothetical protein
MEPNILLRLARAYLKVANLPLAVQNLMTKRNQFSGNRSIKFMNDILFLVNDKYPYILWLAQLRIFTTRYFVSCLRVQGTAGR